jgi:hypothetical protein
MMGILDQMGQLVQRPFLGHFHYLRLVYGRYGFLGNIDLGGSQYLANFWGGSN